MAIKTIYLDQNKWIELARASKGDASTEIIDVLNLIKTKVASSEWIFPLSWTHLLETAKIRDDAKRKFLSSLMRDISKGLRLPPYTEVQEVEVKNMFYAVKNGMQNIPKANVINRWAEINGLPSEIELPFDVSDFSIMVEAIHSAAYEDLDDGLEYAKFLNDHRAWISKYPKQNQQDLFLYNFFDRILKQNEGYYINLRITKDEVDKYFSSKLSNKAGFIAHIKQSPALYCESQFIHDLMRNPNKTIEPHDANDIAALCVAIPYCDVVIAERQWSNIAKNTLHLDSDFGATITTSLTSLLAL